MMRPGGFGMIPPVIKNLILINAVVFLVTLLFGDELIWMLGLHYPSSPGFEPYQIVTFMFTHGGLFHIFFNMLALWMFGSEIEMIWGPRRFLIYYLACSLGAAVLHFTIAHFRLEALMENRQAMDPNAFRMAYLSIRDIPVVGASGSVYGILLAFGMMFPNRRLFLLFPPIPIKAKYLVIGYGAIELFSGISNTEGDNIAHFAHLGGMLTGLILILIWKSQHRFYR